MMITDDGNVIMDNQTIAILTKVNELAERFGIKSYEFVAEVTHDRGRNSTELAFTSHDEHVAGKMENMLDAIAGKGGMVDGSIYGDEAILKALDRALAVAPKPRVK